MDDSSSKQSLLGRLINKISGEEAPESQEEVAHLLRLAQENKVLNTDTFILLEKALDFSNLEVRDVMISRSQMDVIKINDSFEKIIAYIIETTHSRFPVIGEDKDDVLGILHSKDLLQFFIQPFSEFNLQPLLREAMFVPESKSLHALANEFRDKHYHLAIVVDEYGGTSGLITFEDVIEELTGEIEDEFDEEDEEVNIIEVAPGRFRINAVTTVEEFNKYFQTKFSDEEVDTIGGLVVSEFGRLPLRGEKITIDGWQFTITRVDHRRLYIVMVTDIS